jgi:hypothetical protein
MVASTIDTCMVAGTGTSVGGQGTREKRETKKLVEVLEMPEQRRSKAGKESIEMNINHAIFIGVVDSVLVCAKVRFTSII